MKGDFALDLTMLHCRLLFILKADDVYNYGDFCTL